MEKDKLSFAIIVGNAWEMNSVRQALAWYGALRARRPIASASVTSGLIFMLGDGLAQHAIERRSEHDWHRTGRLAVVGSCYTGPVLSQWYKFMSQKIRFESKNVATVVRVAVDQIFFAPVFLLGGYFAINGILEGKSYEQIKDKFRASYLTSALLGAPYWCTLQLFNFRFVPMEFQLPMSNLFNIVWQGYLSSVNANPELAKRKIHVDKLAAKVDAKAAQLEQKIEKKLHVDARDKI